MNQEILFAKTLEQVKRTAKEQGNTISEKQVKEAFLELALNDAQLEMVYDYLRKHKIGIGQPADPDEYLTDEEKDYLKEYLEEIAALPSYTEGQREAYTIEAMAGDGQAQKQVTEMYLQEVADIARLYTGQGVSLEDLIGEGNVALALGVTMLGSLETPKEAGGMLTKLIMDAMEEAIALCAAGEAQDKKLADKVNRVSDKAKELSEELHRKVTVQELSAETGMSVKSIRDAMRMSGFQIEYLEKEEEA